jgi:hypothetical protein
MALEEYRWECVYPNCTYSILSYTLKGFEDRKREHMEKHIQKVREEREEREQKRGLLSRVDKPSSVTAPESPKRDINKLILTLYDIIQFELRGIKIDEDCIVDGYSS